MPAASSLLSSLPNLVQENLTLQFSFFAQANLHTGMNFESKLYVLHRSFRQHKRAHAFALASALMHQGVSAVVTVSSQDLFYKVWLDLRHVACLHSGPLLEDADNSIFNPIEYSHQLVA